jgi:hypothetical protein
VISRRFGATVLAAVFALGAAACDDNPVDEGRDDSARLYLSHENAAVASGGTIVVTANVLNQYGEPTGASVTGQACDNKITVTADTARSAFENPERFRVTGASFGTSCVVVSPKTRPTDSDPPRSPPGRSRETASRLFAD